MKTFIRISILAISLPVISACAAGNTKIPEKYNLDRQLEQVSTIFKYGITDWKKVDNQSLLLQRGPGEYYLIVLKTPAMELPFRSGIKFSSTGDMIRAGLDDVIFYNGANMKLSYPIDRIYRIRGTEQMLAIRDQLTGETTDGQKEDSQTRKSIKSRSINDKGVDI
jgi:hypothetical protein